MSESIDRVGPRAGRLQAREARVPGERSMHGFDLLPATSLQVDEGELVLVAGDPGPAHLLLALSLAGRLDGMAGSVTLDGNPDRRVLQRAVAPVDVPGVNEPGDAMPVRTVVGEELAMAGQPAGRAAVRAVLTEAGIDPGARMAALTGAQRVGLMLSLALLRRPRFVILPLPERHGGRPGDWADQLALATQAGVGVIVTASHTLADHYRLGTVVQLGNATSEGPAEAADPGADDAAPEPRAPDRTDPAETAPNPPVDPVPDPDEALIMDEALAVEEKA